MSETIRIEHSRDYTVISNVAVRDKKLSFKARGLHHLLLSYPSGWEIKIEHLVTESETDGKAAICAALQELEKSGYLIRTQLREKGKIIGYSSVIREVPINAPEISIKGRRKSKNKGFEPQTDFPDTENRDMEPQTDFPDTENRDMEPQTDFPDTEKPYPEKPYPENRSHNKYVLEEISNKQIPTADEPQKKGEVGLSGEIETVVIATQNIPSSPLAKTEISHQADNLFIGQNSLALANAEKQISIETSVKENLNNLMPRNGSVVTSNPPLAVSSDEKSRIWMNKTPEDLENYCNGITGRRFNNSKAVPVSCSADPWMNGANVDKAFLDWYFSHRQQERSRSISVSDYVPSRANLSSEIRGDYVRAMDIYQDYLSFLRKQEQNKPATITNLIDFPSMHLVKHQAVFRDLVKFGFENFMAKSEWNDCFTSQHLDDWVVYALDKFNGTNFGRQLALSPLVQQRFPHLAQISA